MGTGLVAFNMGLGGAGGPLEDPTVILSMVASTLALKMWLVPVSVGKLVAVMAVISVLEAGITPCSVVILPEASVVSTEVDVLVSMAVASALLTILFEVAVTLEEAVTKLVGAARSESLVARGTAVLLAKVVVLESAVASLEVVVFFVTVEGAGVPLTASFEMAMILEEVAMTSVGAAILESVVVIETTVLLAELVVVESAVASSEVVEFFISMSASSEVSVTLKGVPVTLVGKEALGPLAMVETVVLVASTKVGLSLATVVMWKSGVEWESGAAVGVTEASPVGVVLDTVVALLEVAMVLGPMTRTP